MDIVVNIHDQPRIVVPFGIIQKHPEAEQKSRQMIPAAADRFTEVVLAPRSQVHGDRQNGLSARIPGWCLRHDNSRLYETQFGAFVSNFNLSTDLCTVGPAIEDQHSFLFSPTTLVVSQKLLPVFSECKVSVNNDILFPANVYTMTDPRYLYDPKFDFEWEDKADSLLWRGASSGGGGIAAADSWHRLHRQRLVLLSNGTLNHNGQVSILSENAQHAYETNRYFNSSDFTQKHFDVGFTEFWGCIPEECPFYNWVLGVRNSTQLSEQFKSKYLVNVDGHSFSGRWRAFHFSKSLSLKATIFREWHDSRLFAWRHFVPLDNRYDELYSLMTYFIGMGSPVGKGMHNDQQEPYIRSHDFEAKMIASESRDQCCATKILKSTYSFY
ncbi:uncharacterized protein ATNIH1004_011736 [Aspergillus tanneri]|uniref:Glycosyl transferase CAP10 domain-containing protein n=1 Tax=Aspergillus tanneri TaxID=1220188 RepID=A0A5M9M7X1_9EURO|nr:uncharacterized protein ATNIH1004_011736 [Aspergillus tanneri]KAA8641600.1 hypothetical protein ATNIH1004_011736 [Aspergillus tanneri]